MRKNHAREREVWVRIFKKGSGQPQSLGRQNLYPLAFRTTNMKTAAGRARKIAALVEMLERGETPHPERR